MTKQKRTCRECRWYSVARGGKNCKDRGVRPRDEQCPDFSNLMEPSWYQSKDKKVRLLIRKLEQKAYSVDTKFRSELRTFRPFTTVDVPNRMLVRKDMEALSEVLVRAQGFRDRAVQILDDLKHLQDRLSYLYDEAWTHLAVLPEIRKLAPKDTRDGVLDAILEPISRRVSYVDRIVELARDTVSNLSTTGDTVDRLIMVYRSTRKQVGRND